MFIKKWLSKAVLLSQIPLGVFWRVFIQPILSLGYRGIRSLKKWLLVAFEPIKKRLGGKFTTHTIIFCLMVAVIIINTQSYRHSDPTESLARHSLISKISGNEIENLLLEQAVPVEYAKEVTYLGAHAVRPRPLGISGTESNQTNSDTTSIEDIGNTLVNNAIRVQADVVAVDTQETLKPKTRTSITEHIVQEGESVGSIANKYGLKTLTILSANDLSARSIIRPGQKIKIMPVDGVVYKVKSGDTLIKISNTYKSDVNEIMSFNGLASAGTLSVGQTLILPGGSEPPPPAPKNTLITTKIKQVFTPAEDTSSNTRLLWPTSARRVTQYYNWSHRGVDIAGPVGTPIYAADDGVVTFSGWNDSGYGRLVIVDHQNGLFTRYAHASRNLVQKGDVVKRGDVIQLMGSTGRSTGPHIHFEVLKGNLSNRLNPFDFIK
jgi:LysM repeat protein